MRERERYVGLFLVGSKLVEGSRSGDVDALVKSQNDSWLRRDARMKARARVGKRAERDTQRESYCPGAQGCVGVRGVASRTSR